MACFGSDQYLSLALVLGALCEPPFEPLESVDLKVLSYKTALLMTLAKSLAFELFPFSCPPFASSEQRRLHGLCLVHALRTYRTKDIQVAQACPFIFHQGCDGATDGTAASGNRSQASVFREKAVFLEKKESEDMS
ncbi:hypothetical protein J4Q44_G00227540 [Coregonus suidteri]|uniref:Uncharacterized protein n=1 Tax=Coregonus suidteri TaxID=861788 RepID=A0AAN8LT39_9TELE